MRKTQAQKLESRRERQRLVKKYKWLYLFAFPGVVVLILFAYLPMVGLVMAFQQYDPVSGFFGSPWVGLYNFQRLFSTPTFGRAFRNTLIISTLKLIVCFPMPILVSLLINELRRARVKKTIQTVVYIPNFVSWVIAAGLWYSLLGNSGVVNSLLMGLGITQEPVMFMQSLGWFSLSNTELLEICQKWAQKKQQIFFGFTASCAAAGRRDIQFLWWFSVVNWKFINYSAL